MASNHPPSMPVDSPLDSVTRSQLLSTFCLDLSLLVSGPLGTFTLPCRGTWQLWNLPQPPHIHRKLGSKFRPSFCPNVQYLLICCSQYTLEIVLSPNPKGKMTESPLVWKSSSVVFWGHRGLNLMSCLSFSPPAFPLFHSTLPNLSPPPNTRRAFHDILFCPYSTTYKSKAWICFIGAVRRPRTSFCSW